MKQFMIAALALAAVTSGPALAGEACAPLGLDKPALLELRADGFSFADTDEARRFAVELVPCLAEADPDLRDKIGYEGFAALLRGGQLDRETMLAVGKPLIEWLYDPDTNGFRKPFAALVLSEIARVDRLEPFLSDEERAGLVTTATDYLKSVDDYRGFDQEEGWRHGVAHGADLLLQLSLNEAVTAQQLEEMRAAVASQVMPQATHFYIYGEPERLARPILFTARRGLISEEDWTAWFEALADPAPFDGWGDVFFSEDGLARRHNLRAFALAIYANAAASEDENVRALLPGALAILRATA